MDNNILGKYVPRNTFIHRLDPRMKILGMILLMINVFLTFGSWTLMFFLAGVNAVIISILLIISKVRFRDLIVQLKTIWFMMIILLIINIFLPPNGSVHIIWQSGNFKLYAESFLQTGRIVIRLLEMFALASILTATTTPIELTQGFAFFMKPLKKIKFPAEEIAMTIAIALRFIPTLLEETTRIYKAQSSRGMDFKHGGFKTKIKGVISLIIPLFVSCFAISDDLAFALDARGYNPRENRTSYRKLHWSIKDTISILLVLIITIAFIVFCAMRIDVFKEYFPHVW